MPIPELTIVPIKTESRLQHILKRVLSIFRRNKQPSFNHESYTLEWIPNEEVPQAGVNFRVETPVTEEIRYALYPIPKHLEYILELSELSDGRISEMEFAVCLLHAKAFEKINFNDPIHIYNIQRDGSWRDYRDSKGRYITSDLAHRIGEYSNLDPINYLIINYKFYILHNCKKVK